jgi:3-deoxy-manno-octulosonate cytidylyltransferase (CMP-KDO synthetase)
MQLTELPPGGIELSESIEQMRILENGFSISSVPVTPSLPSVNEPREAQIILEYIEHNVEQQKLLNAILSS